MVSKIKSQKKIDFKDRIRAVLLTAIIIFGTSAIALTGFYLHALEPETSPQPLQIVTGRSVAAALPDRTTISPPVESSDVIGSVDATPFMVSYIEILPEPAGGTLVLVIDDAGYSFHDLEPFLAFPGNLTIAVLPGLPESAETARRVREAGKEVFLHQPMESLRGNNASPSTIFSGMDEDEIREIVNRNLDELWPVAGMNNHEGSLVTMNEDIMKIILEICRERDILFLDSRTTSGSVVSEVAERMGITVAVRDIFIDNDQDTESMHGYINMGLVRAERNGSAVLIGHVWSPALAQLLTELYDGLTERNFVFSTISHLILEEEL